MRNAVLDALRARGSGTQMPRTLGGGAETCQTVNVISPKYSHMPNSRVTSIELVPSPEGWKLVVHPSSEIGIEHTLTLPLPSASRLAIVLLERVLSVPEGEHALLMNQDRVRVLKQLRVILEKRE